MKSTKKVEMDSLGILTLMEIYQSRFKVPENLNHYSPEDYKIAERAFLIWCLKNRPPITS